MSANYVHQNKPTRSIRQCSRTCVKIGCTHFSPIKFLYSNIKIKWKALFSSSENNEMDWEDLFGEEQEEQDKVEINGLVHIKQALDHDQQMLVVNQLIEHGYFSDTNQAMCFGELPTCINWLIPWICANHPTLFPKEIMQRQPLFDQAILNLYKKGQGIVSHVDLLRFDDGIIIVSLLSSCVMTMRPANHNDKQSEGSVRRDILLRPGDILALSGEARYHWKHGIEERLIDEIDGETIERGTRISVTLRRLKEQEE